MADRTPVVDGGMDDRPFGLVVAFHADLVGRGDEEGGVVRAVGAVAGGALAVLDGGMHRRAGHFIVALVAECASLLNEAKLLVVTVILVAGVAFAAFNGVVSIRDGGKYIVAFVTSRLFGCRRQGMPGPEDHRKGSDAHAGST
jgi:hypothetical protein